MSSALSNRLRHVPIHISTRPSTLSRQQWFGSKRWVQISTRLAGDISDVDQILNDADRDISAGSSDAGFEVLGAPYSLLKVTLSASQPFFTRRGTLVGLSGKVENVVSSLSFLGPLTRAVLGIPFFYQKISSASPVTALISSRSNYSSFATIHLDGTMDWMVAQRNALLCWTGQTISLSPRMNTSLSLANWGSTQVTGRGLLAVVGKGLVCEIDIRPGEQYVVHPSNIVAYSMNRQAPLPYRIKSSVLSFQIPGLNRFQTWASGIKFLQNMQQTTTWKVIAGSLFTIRTWSRRTIWGDRLFLQFQGPATILLQTRSSRIRDVLSAREVNEIADSEPGVMPPISTLSEIKSKDIVQPLVKAAPSPTKVSYASVGKDGNVKFDVEKP